MADQNRQRRGVAQRLVGKPLDHNAQQRAQSHGNDNGQQRRHAHLVHRNEHDVAAHHDHITMGEVQHLGDAIHHGVAQGDDGIHTAQADTVD